MIHKLIFLKNNWKLRLIPALTLQFWSRGWERLMVWTYFAHACVFHRARAGIKGMGSTQPSIGTNFFFCYPGQTNPQEINCIQKKYLDMWNRRILNRSAAPRYFSKLLYFWKFRCSRSERSVSIMILLSYYYKETPPKRWRNMLRVNWRQIGPSNRRCLFIVFRGSWKEKWNLGCDVHLWRLFLKGSFSFIMRN